MTTDTDTILTSLYQYQAWANQEILASMRELSATHHAEQLHQSSRAMNHCLVVNKIFIAHLTGVPHGFDADNTPDTPTVHQLIDDMAITDRWYLDYVARVTPALLAEAIPLTFTDGDRGTMTRQEMLLHVVTHNGYHRGEAGRLLKQAVAQTGHDLRMPWDTFAVHLHRGDPARRVHGR